ncbi:MAG: peptidase sporulation factor SpoIIGA [Bacillota bacterium]|nr:peptidase sporulation factor SpoIIGA [Bacillota bacterium]
MVIYAEYLFLENALTGGLILLLTAGISGIRCKKLFLILGSILCGIYSFMIFWDSLHPLLALLSKLVFSFGLVFMVFQPKTLRRFGRITLVFYLISFAMGGITIGLMYFLGIQGVTQNSSIYMNGFGYVYVALGCAMTFGIFHLFAGFIKGRMIRERIYADVEISLEGTKETLKGLVDTGNFLADPVSGKPVFLINEQGAKKLFPTEILQEIMQGNRSEHTYERLMSSRYATRIRLIPYRTVGDGKGYFIGVRTDSIRIDILNCSERDRTSVVSEGAVLAVNRGLFTGERSCEGCSILLHPSLLEGGIACNA